MMEQIARCTKPPKAGEYSAENKYSDEEFSPSRFFTEETKVASVRLSEMYPEGYLYNANKTCFAIENLSPHNAVNKAARSSD